jgi:hypothetical protein
MDDLKITLKTLTPLWTGWYRWKLQPSPRDRAYQQPALVLGGLGARAGWVRVRPDERESLPR